MSEVDTFYSSWFHQVQVLNGESEVNLYLDYVAKLEGYPSVEDYLKRNPVYLYEVPEGKKLEGKLV